MDLPWVSEFKLQSQGLTGSDFNLKDNALPHIKAFEHSTEPLPHTAKRKGRKG